jgi:hypothetical protein
MKEQICPGCGMPHRRESAYCSPECIELDPDAPKAQVVVLKPRIVPISPKPAGQMIAEIIPFNQVRVPGTVSRHRKQKARFALTAKDRRAWCLEHCRGYSLGLYCYPDCQRASSKVSGPDLPVVPGPQWLP